MKSRSTGNTWIHVQQNTFTNWINEQLSADGLRVSDLQEDLRDGVILARLVESLQFRRIGKIFMKPQNQIQMLQNVDLVFRAIMEDKIKIVNIGKRSVFHIWNADILNASTTSCSMFLRVIGDNVLPRLHVFCRSKKCLTLYHCPLFFYQLFA